MKTPRSYRKFQFQQDKIRNLEERRVLVLKEFIPSSKTSQTEIWDIETGDRDSKIPDDFMMALQLQTNFLEDRDRQLA